MALRLTVTLRRAVDLERLPRPRPCPRPCRTQTQNSWPCPPITLFLRLGLIVPSLPAGSTISCPSVAGVSSCIAKTISFQASMFVLFRLHSAQVLLRLNCNLARRRRVASQASSLSSRSPHIWPIVSPHCVWAAGQPSAPSMSPLHASVLDAILPSTALRHRSPISHDCTLASDTTIPVSDKNAAAKALFAKHFGTDPASNTARPVPSSSKIHARKEAQQRQLAAMRMRHKAQPGNPKGTPASVPVDQRLHVKVVKADSPFSERIFWFSKVSSIFFYSYRLTVSCQSRQ